jgi:hypothetical protein
VIGCSTNSSQSFGKFLLLTNAIEIGFQRLMVFVYASAWFAPQHFFCRNPCISVFSAAKAARDRFSGNNIPQNAVRQIPLSKAKANYVRLKGGQISLSEVKRIIPD